MFVLQRLSLNKHIYTNVMKLKSLLIFTIFFFFLLSEETSLANRRHFTYAYESAVLPKAAREIELWNTVRVNHKDFYRGLDNRTEFEFGLGGNLQTSLYLNLSIISQFSNGAIGTEQFFGISNEWKYKLLDATADPIGMAIYGEGSIRSDEIEIEGKIILDKQVDNILFVFNAVGEHSFVTGINSSGLAETQPENILEFVGGAAYFLAPSFTIGIEARQHTQKPPIFEGGGVYSAFFAGPSFSVSGSNWWSALSIIAQVAGSEETGTGIRSQDKLDLTKHEKLEARLLLSFDF